MHQGAICRFKTHHFCVKGLLLTNKDSVSVRVDAVIFSLSLIMNGLTLNQCYVCKKIRLFVLALAPAAALSPPELDNKSR